MPRARPGILVVGVGSPLREDDAVGLELASRLEDYFEGTLDCIILPEPDISLAERISNCRQLIIVDALAEPSPEPFRMIKVEPSGRCAPTTGFVTHVFDWAMILTLSAELYGRAPEAWVFGVRATSMNIGEGLSAQCRDDAECAFEHLKGLVSD